jgi:hypothetical protein
MGEMNTCKNCGNPTTFTGSCSFGRMKLQWCVPCFRSGVANNSIPSGTSKKLPRWKPKNKLTKAQRKELKKKNKTEARAAKGSRRLRLIEKLLDGIG